MNNLAIDHKIDRFISKIELGVSFFHDAGKMLVAMLDEDPHVGEEILKRNIHWLTQDVLTVFEQIGRDQLAVEAMFLPRHVAQRMIGLPLEEQARIANEPIEVQPIREGHRSREYIRRVRPPVTKMAKDLSPRQAAVAIGPQGVRSADEQKAVIATMEVIQKPSRDERLYELLKQIEVHCCCGYQPAPINLPHDAACPLAEALSLLGETHERSANHNRTAQAH